MDGQTDMGVHNIPIAFLNKNSSEVDVAPALGKVTGVRNLGQGYKAMSDYGRFDTHSYHRYRKMHFNARINVKS